MNCADAPALYRYNLIFILINIFVMVNVTDIYLNERSTDRNIDHS